MGERRADRKERKSWGRREEKKMERGKGVDKENPRGGKGENRNE